jgi:signal recognition particle subunit SRP54
MFESLQDGLKGAFKSLRGHGKLTEANMREGLKLVENSLLEADVSIEVIRDFMQRVTERAVGEKVLLALRPSEQVTAIVRDELINLLGPVGDGLQLNQELNVIMMCGLQGSGKTTTCGKLAKLLQREKITPLLVAADLQRPAAIDQLHVLGSQLNIPVFSNREEKDPVKVCQAAIAKAKADKNRVVILDTAGRLAIDQELMEQLKTIDRQILPDHVFLVVDGMTGQDAVRSAKAFHDALELNGVIMTKLDGDARGGALLSVKHVTGVPIRFIGTGEHLDNLEFFRPEGMANRILGMGDVLALVEEAQKLVDEKEQQKLQEALEKGQFTLDDFRNHIAKMAKPGLLQRMMGLLPGMPNINELMGNQDTSKQIRQMVGVIDSMTPAERRNPSLIQVSRRQRIANGAGVQPKQVSDLVKQFETMKPLLTGMAGMGATDRLKEMQQLQKSMMDPSKGLKKPKERAGRLTPAEKKRLAKERERKLRQMKRKRDGGSVEEVED